MVKRFLTLSSIRQTLGKLILLTLLFGFSQNVASVAQISGAKQPDSARPLIPGEAIARELSGGQSHSYSINIAAGSYLRLLLTSQDLNLESKLFAPNSSVDIGVIHFPSERELRFISLIAETSGNYRLEIYPAEKNAQAGHYEMKIEELRPASEQDKTRVSAERIEQEGVSLLHFSNTVEQKQQGIKKYEEALELWHKLGDDKGKLRILAYLDIQYRYLGEPQIALEYRKQAIEIARSVGDRYQEANLIIGAGMLQKSLSENQKALDSFEQARQIFKSLSARYGEAIAIQNIALTLLDLGEWQNGLQYLNEALQTYSAVGNRGGEASILNSIGSAHRYLGDIQKAIEFHNRALVIARANKVLSAEVISLSNLGSAYLASGNKQQALDFFEQSLKQSRISGVRVLEGAILKMIGDVAYLSGDYAKALDYLNQALGVFRSIWERNKEAKVLHSLAQVHYALGNFEEAKKQLEIVLETQESLRSNIISQQLRESIFTSAQSSFSLYIDVLMQLHRKNPAANLDAQALQASEQARARSLLDLLGESRADIRQGVSQDLLNLERSLQQQINAKAEARTRLLSDKRMAIQATSIEDELTQLTSRQQEVKAQIRQRSPNYAALTQPQPLSATEIQQQLDDNTVLLEFALGEKQSWLWAVTTSQIISFQLPPRCEIEASARQVYDLFAARQPKPGESKNSYHNRITEADAQLPNQMSTLSQMLFEQITAQLRQQWKGKRLAIVAPGALEYIPFAALPMPDANQQKTEVKQDAPQSAVNNRQSPLITQYEIVNLPSASALAALRRETYGRKPAEKQVVVLADPVFTPTDSRLLNAMKKTASQDIVANVRSGGEAMTDSSATTTQTSVTLNADLMRSMKDVSLVNDRDGFSRLPFSREEAEAIASFAPKNSLMKAVDFQANRAIATNGELSHYRIVHFATHGLLNSQHPELSGLVLSLIDENGKAQDGFLRMHEIYNLHLPADLIVLSACQTALGKEIKGEGLVGLTRGFMYAGAQRVVASLWQVDDFATAQLMKSFYRGMLKEGLRPAAALRAAQLEMLKQKPWSSPFFWAAFTIQGEWK